VWGGSVIIPYNTDAPVYHPPIATVGLILINTVVFFATFQHPDLEPWMLSFGQGLQPVQWITSVFLHAGIDHLIGNMVFLWVFGLVIEGKIGWWRFLLVYLGLGAFESAAAQIMMLGGDGFALGASGAIYGLLAMSLIWAPSNDVHCVGFWLVYAKFFEVPIMGFAAFYVGWEILIAWLGNFEMSSAILHLAGALPGFALGILMLKLGLVDCEQWDIFAVFGGRSGDSRQPEPEVKSTADVARERAARRATAMAIFDEHLKEGRAADACALHQTMSQRLSQDWKLAPEQLLALVKALHRSELWSQSIEPMTEYLREVNEPAPRVRLKLAQILLTHENRPGRALRVLQEIPANSLPVDLDRMRQRLATRAAAQLEHGELQLEG
jgi:membrane associated rhomboid family serine protease